MGGAHIAQRGDNEGATTAEEVIAVTFNIEGEGTTSPAPAATIAMGNPPLHSLSPIAQLSSRTAD